MAAHWALVAERTGASLDDLIGARPTCPEGAEYLWVAFGRLSAARGSSGFGPLPIGYADVDAFCRLTSFELGPWEVETIRALDDAFLRQCHARSRRANAPHQ